MSEAATSNRATIAVLGGTGHEGGGLALRWAAAGHTVIIGSRTAERAKEAAEKFSKQAGKPIEGLANKEAAAKAEIVVIAVPYAAQAGTAKDVSAELQGKILVNRPALREAREFLRRGDTLIVWKLDRLARSMKQLIEAMRNCE